MRCAVLGSPIAHSLSPVLHRAAYAHLGLDWTYDAVEMDSPGLRPFVEALDETWRGLSLTMPLKRTVVPLVDSLDEWAQLAGVANTVLLEDGRRLGFNTDIPGAMAAIVERVRRAGPFGSGDRRGSHGGVAAARARRARLPYGDAARAGRGPCRGDRYSGRVPPSMPRSCRSPRSPGPSALEADLVVSTVPARGPDAGAAGRLRRHPGCLRGRLRPVADAAGARGAGVRSTAGQRPRPARAPGGAAGGPDDRGTGAGRPGPRRGPCGTGSQGCAEHRRRWLNSPSLSP